MVRISWSCHAALEPLVTYPALDHILVLTLILVFLVYPEMVIFRIVFVGGEPIVRLYVKVNISNNVSYISTIIGTHV